ncbi:MAG: nitroreductase family protein [Deltaproteobacteria bacterium]|nr:nitroreductase family protein [Deltaproteobacteria bacterium]
MFVELVRTRRSVRRYLATPVEPAQAELLLEAALRAPSSQGQSPCHFVVVSDPKLLSDLSRAKPHGASFLGGAPLAIVVCADPSKGDVWVEDAAIATTFVHLAAASLGLGSCWIQIRGRVHDASQTSSAYVAQCLQLPPGLEVEAIIAVGSPAESPSPHPHDSLAFSRVSYDRFGQGL